MNNRQRAEMLRGMGLEVPTLGQANAPSAWALTKAYASGTAEGYRGAQINNLNVFTFGGSNKLGDWLHGSSDWRAGLDGRDYQSGMIAATVARESLITAATLGTAQAYRAGGSLAYGALATVGEGYSTVQNGKSIISGAQHISEGNYWGALEIAGGALGLKANYAAATQLAGGLASKTASVAAQEGRFVGLTSKGKLLTPDTQAICFVAGTQVVTGINADGSYITKNIEDIRTGDRVESRDQYDDADDVSRHQVVRTFVHTAYSLQIVKIRDASGNVETIKTTAEHPFFVQGIGWVRAGSLAAGMTLDEADGSNNALVISSTAESHPEGVTVYNFEVDGDHTYFIEDGRGEQTAVWVHNRCNNWDIARKAYWKAAALTESLSQRAGMAANYSRRNLVRMGQGLAPRFLAEVERAGERVIERVSMELHHDIGHRFSFFFKNMKFNLKQVTPWAHEAVDQFRHTGSKLIQIIKDVNEF